MKLPFSERYLALQNQIKDLALKSGRGSQDVTIIGVTKTHPADTIQNALSNGLIHIGENKVQEAAAKQEIIGHRGTWHMIGHLQKNKAKLAVRLFDSIDAVDSLELAQVLNSAAQEIGKNLSVLLEVNTSGEASKFGVKPSNAATLAEKINALPRLTLRGLMTLAPYFEAPEKTRPAFAALRECRDKIQTETGLSLPELSMGMSNDFTVAIEEGATQVRLGTILFGPRQKIKLNREESDL